MTDFLVATLYAPLASWGDIAVGEVRGSWDRPSRSAILGLVAAALGLTRDDQAGHDALDAGYGVAVRVNAPGTTFNDYHTAQTVAASVLKRTRPTTRAQMLALGERQTILSRRALQQDSLATLALWSRHDPRWSLAQLAQALRQPKFVLYAGRKANALGLPLDPQVISAPSLADAFRQVDSVPAAMAEAFRRSTPRGSWGTEVSHDPCEGFPSGLQPLRQEVRRDAAAHRLRWHFAERTVHVGVLGDGASA